MRKLIYAINLTLDGCCDHTKGVPDEEMMEYHTWLLHDAGLLVYGRKTYELMVPYWPDVAKNPSGDKAENEFARVFDTKDRLVFSKTLGQIADTKTRIVRTNPAEEILKLKQVPGKNMLIGGVSLPSYLLEHGLIDEFHFVVHPVVAGEGRRLFADTFLPDSLQLELAATKVFKSGGMALRYLKS